MLLIIIMILLFLLLIFALVYCTQEAVEALLRHRADITARDKNWQTPLHVAAANNSYECALFLVPLITNINITDQSGRTSLHHAAHGGHIEVEIL